MARRWLDLESARSDAAELGVSQFMARHPTAVLVAGEIKEGRMTRREQGTMLLSASGAAELAAGRMPDRGRYCLVGEGADATGWLHIGRTVDSDIVINDFTVSKNHAQVRFDELEGGWWLEDLGSTNHSFADKSKLKPREKVLVKSHTVLRFGRLNFTLLGPSAFHAFLRGPG
jgi:hypothetical protein